MRLAPAFILAILLKTASLYGQDTLSLYFETGASKINTAQIKLLNSISDKYDLSELDSVYYVGLADSIGNASLNLKLSEKRAKNIASYCEKLIPKTTFIKIIARGESVLEQAKKNRKVDIVFYFQQPKMEEVEQIETILLHCRL